MRIIDEVNEVNIFQMNSEDIIEALNSIKSDKEAEIRMIKGKIDKYEKKGDRKTPCTSLYLQ